MTYDAAGATSAGGTRVGGVSSWDDIQVDSLQDTIDLQNQIDGERLVAERYALCMCVCVCALASRLVLARVRHFACVPARLCIGVRHLLVFRSCRVCFYRFC